VDSSFIGIRTLLVVRAMLTTAPVPVPYQIRPIF
jgi:hypothetical protein